MAQKDISFKNITENIKRGNLDAVHSEIDAIVDSTGDLMIMLKCASVLKTIGDESGCQSIVDKIIEKTPADDNISYQIGISIRSLGRPKEAYDFISRMSSDNDKKPEIARTLMMISRSEEALSLLSNRNGNSIKDRILICEIYCSLERYDEALIEAEKIVDEERSYQTLVNLVNVMMRMGNEKDAIKLVKTNLKSDKNNPDSLALEAYVMWINGRIPAAANYANKALKIDYSHVGALETMAMCLISKGKKTEAKMLAGVINENDPTNPAVIRILNACP